MGNFLEITNLFRCAKTWWILLAIILLAMIAPTVRTIFHNLNSPQMYIRKVGSGQPMLLLHGLSGSHRYWQNFETKFSHQFEMTMPDLVGFGNSKWPDSGYTMEEQIDSLKKGFPDGKFVLIGHSLGSLIAIEIAKRFPEKIEKLVLLSPPSILDRADLKQILKSQSKWESIMALDSIWAPLACHIHELLGPLSFYLMRPFVSKNLPDYIVRDASKHRWKSYNQTLNNIILEYRAIDQLKNLSVNYLVLAGTEDGYTKNSQLQGFRNAKFIPGGHNFAWDNPRSTRNIISEYLENL